MSPGNYWDELMGSDDGAASYMITYGEGPGCATRLTIGEFINDGESVLDIGAGPGWNYDHFKEFGPQVDYLGLDYSQRFVRVANQRTQEKHGVQPFSHGDCRSLQFPDDTFDAVILQDCLEHTNGYEKPVLEALRVARKRVIVTFWHLTENDDHINDDGNDGYGAWYSRPKWEAFLNTLPYVWFDTETAPTANRQHWFYIIDKQEGHRA